MIKNKKLTAIIPVRKGSQRVKNKNLKSFAGSSLLEIKINQLKRIKDIDEIIVSSDSELMMSVAKKKNVTSHKREKYYASSKANNSEFFENLASFINTDYVMYAPVTAPMLKDNSIKKCINFLKKKSHFKSVATTNLIKEHLWLNNKPYNYKLSDAPSSQDLPDIMSITFGCCILKKIDMLKFRNVITDKTKFFILEQMEAIDIDTNFEFQMGEYFYKKYRK
jgi:CMP-N-acetylneuraminic acid synthetase